MSLDDMTLEELVAEARRLGVSRPERMDRAELLRRLGKRGRFRSARNLLGRVVDRVREALPGGRPPRTSPSSAPPPGSPPRTPDEPIVTRTLAGLLAAQGHDARALAIYDHLLALDPGDRTLSEEAEALRARSRHRHGAPAPDEVVAVPVDGGALLVSWHVGAPAIARARAVLGEEGQLCARVVLVVPDQLEVVRSDVVERTPIGATGEWLLGAVPSTERCTVSIGLLGETRFVSMTHTRVATPA